MHADLDILFLGSGSALGDWRINYNNNAAVRTGLGWVLIDCGVTAPQALKELEIPPSQVIGVVVTHMHSDHYGGIAQLVWERLYSGTRPMWARTRVYAADDVAQMLEGALHSEIKDWTDPSGECSTDGEQNLEVMRKSMAKGVHGQRFTIGDVTFELYPNRHVGDKPSYGVVLTGPRGAKAVYTSDTIFKGRKHHAMLGTDRDMGVVFHECTFSPHYRGTVHTHYEELLHLRRDPQGREVPASDASRTIIMHHHEVPKGIDVRADGFAWAAHRFDRFHITRECTVVTNTTRGGLTSPQVLIGEMPAPEREGEYR